MLQSIVEKLLLVEKRGRTDIEPAISFLYTRVAEIIKEDKAKLRQLLQYLKHTINNKTILGADSLSQL